MNEPTRWRDDPSQAPTGVLELLDAVPPTPALPPGVQRRASRRVAQLGAASATALVWVAAKSAAAAGATGLVTLMAVTVVVERATPPATSEPAPVVQSAAPTVEAPPPPRLRPQPEDPAAVEEEASPPPAVAAFPLVDTPEDALRVEARLIERARAALGESPARALELVREHQTRFPRAQLAAERTIVEIDALRRLGRRAEAEALAERVLAHEPKGLYASRVRRALGEN